jgi:hypothetical protein
MTDAGLRFNGFPIAVGGIFIFDSDFVGCVCS